MKKAIELKVNGDRYEVLLRPHQTLLEILREKLLLTGTKRGCDLGACGACTILMDGEPVLACLTLAVDAAGKEILTIEGLSRGNELHPLQEAFIQEGAVQCGFCSPGMILTAKAVLDEEGDLTRDRVIEGLSGNLCRCTGYKKVVEAVMVAAKKMKGGR